MRVYEPHTAARPATGRMRLILRARAPESGDRRPLVSLNSSSTAALPHLLRRLAHCACDALAWN